MTYDELMALVRACAGIGDAVTHGPDDIDTPFNDLGYDSLAMLETTGRIEQDLGIPLPDDLVSESTTPRRLLDEVNARRAGA